MKKSVTILLIFLFLINCIAYYFLYPLVIDSLKNRFEEYDAGKQHETSVVFVTYSGEENDIIFLNDKEIKADGKLFDILKIERDGNKTIYYCYHDKEEENLEKDFLKRTNDKTRNQRHIVHIQPVGMFLLPGQQPYPKDLQNLSLFPLLVIQNIKTNYLEVPDPPPNFRIIHPDNNEQSA